MYPWRALPRTRRLAAILVLTGALAGGVRLLAGSDHQDTPLVELNPRMDLTDVYAFPGSAPGRIVLVMNTSGFLSPGQTVGRVRSEHSVSVQGGQRWRLRRRQGHSGHLRRQSHQPDGSHPVRSRRRYLRDDERDRLRATDLSGVSTPILVRPAPFRPSPAPDDSFFLDLEAAFCILPDRRPSTGALSQPCALPGGAAFRNPGVNYIEGFNVLSIVVELPSSMLENGAPGKLNIWGTISR